MVMMAGATERAVAHPGRSSGSQAGASLPGSQLPARITTRQPLLARATRVPRKPRLGAAVLARSAMASFA